jgi:uncharacterized glyoxalase superfamily protein PhnB
MPEIYAMVGPAHVIPALRSVETITLFAENLAAVKEFYGRVFGLTPIFEDEVSAVLKLGSVMINLLQASEARELVEPTGVASREVGVRVLFTIAVEDADAVCAALERHGVALLNGPIDRPWGRRTAAFADPAGHVWEIAQELPRR